MRAKTIFVCFAMSFGLLWAAPRNAAAVPSANARAEAAGQASGTVPAGTAVNVRLDTALSTKTSHSGDAFTATVTEPVIAKGRVLIPVGSVVEGTVSKVKNAGMKGKSQLGLRFQTVRLPDGTTANLRAEVASVNAHRNVAASTIQGNASANSEGQVQRSNTRTTEGNVGAGATAGAIAGAVLGGGKGAAIGGLLGAGGGLLVSRHESLSLPVGSTLKLRTTQPVYVH
jgi:hypothetical protein